MKKAYLAIILLIILSFSSCNIEEEVKSIFNTSKKISMLDELSEEGKYDEVIKLCDEILEEDEDSIKAFNMITDAYYELEEYDKVMKYCDRALRKGVESSVVYANKALALYTLGDYDKAEIFADKSLLCRKTQKGFYAQGLARQEAQKYDTALSSFEKSHEIGENFYVNCERFYCLTKLGRFEEAEKFILQIKNESEDRWDYYIYLEHFYIDKGDINGLEKLYEEFEEKYSDNPDAIYELAIRYKNIGKIRTAKRMFMDVFDSYKEDRDMYLWIAYCDLELGDFEDALEKIKLAEDKFGMDYEINKVYAAYEEYNQRYIVASEFYKKAYDENENDYYTVDGLLSNYYRSMRYRKLLELYKDIKKDYRLDENFRMYEAAAYSGLGDSENAIKKYTDLARSKEYGISALYRLIVEYFMINDYKNARKYTEQLIEKDYENENAYEMMDIIERRENSVMKQVKDFFQDNYLYYDEAKFEKISSKYSDDMNSIDDIKNFVSEIKQSDDRFTFVIDGEMYKNIMDNDYKTVYFKEIDQENVFVRIDGFNYSSDDIFIEELDKIQNKENKRLIIDLRGNGGGLIDAANNIANQFIKGGVASNIIYRNGENEAYTCDNDGVNFKEIKILVDENTASSSELLTLTLKTYLNNVEVLGRKTLGKGVGQRVYDNKEKGFCIYTVSLYWNVKEKNIMETKIVPDTYIEGKELKEYLKVINIEI